MMTYKEILNIRREQLKRMKELREALKTAGTDAEREQIEHDIEALSLSIDIVRDNLKCAAVAEVMPAVCEVLNAHAGKIRSVTRQDDIRKELKRRTGFTVRVNLYSGFVAIECGNQLGQLDMHPRYAHELTLADSNGVIRGGLNPDDFIFPYWLEPVYCEDIEKRAAEIIGARDRMRGAYEAFKDAIAEYNRTRPTCATWESATDYHNGYYYGGK